MADAIRTSGTRDVVDLCSGAGGPWPTLIERVGASGDAPRVTLTDRWPNESALARASAAAP